MSMTALTVIFSLYTTRTAESVTVCTTRRDNSRLPECSGMTPEGAARERAPEQRLQAAFELMDGVEGYSSTGEGAHMSALSAIRTVRSAEMAARGGL